MHYSLALTDIADETLRAAILAPLVDYNVSRAGASEGRALSVLVQGAGGEVIGGLSGSTGYRWLFIQLLVVPEALRGRGIGTRLMDMAEAEAAVRGCRAAWVDTFSFQARGFYERCGYTCFGELPDYPPGHSRFFLKKVWGALPGPVDSGDDDSS